jgi:hypothetical protein
MTKDNGNRNKITKWIRRIARIWSFPIILYALLMFIGYTWSWMATGVADPYAVEDYPPIEALPPILMFLGILGLGIAWRWERLGGAINLFFQISVLLVLLITRPITQDFSRSAIPYLFSVVTAIPGILFLIYWWRSSRIPALLNDD